MEEKKATKEKKISTLDDVRPTKKENTVRYRIPKTLMKDINNTEILSPEQVEKYATLLALGMIPDRFGLEAGLDMKLKGLDLLASIKGLKQTKVDAKIQVDTPIIKDDI